MIKKPVSLSLPLSDEDVRSLQAGDAVLLNGIIVTARDRAHKWLFERFIRQTATPSPADRQVYDALKAHLQGGMIYHCGPIVEQLEDGRYRFIAAGPTTSLREEIYEADILRHFNLKGVIGKGGMGASTLQACAQTPAVYLHSVGGAAALIAGSVVEVLDVYKPEFGLPEAMWVIRVKDLPAVVTMDAHGRSLHGQVLESSRSMLEKLIE
jgi:fumarate hydratase class I